MNPIKKLKRVSFKNILKGIFIGLSHPFFVVPTLKATKDCMRISTELFGRQHYKNGPSNAFRHALWNYLIAKRCFFNRKKMEVVTNWAKKITDWHENAFPNHALAQKMDLHNNEVGRFIFRQNMNKSEQETIELLKQMALESVKIDESSVLSEYKNQMVHIL